MKSPVKLIYTFVFVLFSTSALADEYVITYTEDRWGKWRMENAGIIVQVGDTVTFINETKRDQSATVFGRALSEGRNFDTGVLKPGESATVLLEIPGLYEFKSTNFPLFNSWIKVE